MLFRCSPPTKWAMQLPSCNHKFVYIIQYIGWHRNRRAAYVALSPAGINLPPYESASASILKYNCWPKNNLKLVSGCKQSAAKVNLKVRTVRVYSNKLNAKIDIVSLPLYQKKDTVQISFVFCHKCLTNLVINETKPTGKNATNLVQLTDLRVKVFQLTLHFTFLTSRIN